MDVRGTTCLDVGCSTGGFTDCLLRHGAARVVAVDVGRAQFDWSLRQDARVALYERTNVVDLPELIDDRFDLAVCDVSFTSVTTILPAVVAMLAPGGMFVTLVKPQFEAPRADVGEGGIVRSDAVRAARRRASACWACARARSRAIRATSSISWRASSSPASDAMPRAALPAPQSEGMQFVRECYT